MRFYFFLRGAKYQPELMLDKLYPRLPWNAGDFLLPPWSPRALTMVTPAWLLGDREGTLTPIGLSADCALGWRPKRRVWATPHGVWECREDVAARPAFCAFCPERDVLIGECDAECAPTLEGADPPVRDDKGTHLIETPEALVRLFTRISEGRCFFAVVLCRDQADDGTATWQRFEAVSATDALLAALAPYQPFAKRQASLTPDTFRLLESTVARMIRELRTTRDGRRLYRIGLNDPDARARMWELADLARAWCEVRPDVACGLLRSPLDCQGPDGYLPAWFDARGVPSPQVLTRPVCAHAFRLTWMVKADRAWYDEVAPRLKLYLESLVERLDPEETGLPRWETAEQALLPHLCEMEAATPDLPALIVREIDDLDAVSAGVAVRAVDLGALRNYRQKILSRLREDLWNSEFQYFEPKRPDGRPLLAKTIASLVPLVIEELLNSEEEALISLLMNREFLLTDGGLRPWSEGDDASDPRPKPDHQLILLDALELKKLTGAAAALRIAIQKDLPHPNSPAEQALVMAMLAVPVSDRLTTKILSPIANWLERHQKLTAGAAVAVAAAIGISSYWYIAGQQKLAAETLDTTLGFARQLYRQGKYEEAESLMETVLQSENPHATINFEMGNIQYRLGRLDRAAEYYAKQKGPNLSLEAQALHNLAVVRYRQGRVEEAAQIWRRILEEYGDLAPSAQERALSALKILERTALKPKEEGEARQGGQGAEP